jgi:hypothetical protein
VEFKWEAPKHFAPLDGGQSPAKEQGGESSPAKTAAKTAAKTTSDKK